MTTQDPMWDPMWNPMWGQFRPLWTSLARGGTQMLLAGGYGLFLKQRRLAENREQLIVIPLQNWNDAAPRVTKDLDLVLGLELLASVSAQGAIVDAMAENGFAVVKKNPRWQFRKELV